MTGTPFFIEPLHRSHDRRSFDCGARPGDTVLTQYFREQITQDVRRRVASCFVALAGDRRIAGYYTLAATGVPLTGLPESTRKKLPRYPSVPAVLMGRLAVGQEFRGQGLGGALLADALKRAIDSPIAAYAMFVEAKDDASVAFYSHHGFIGMIDSAMKLFLPLETAKRILKP